MTRPSTSYAVFLLIFVCACDYTAEIGSVPTGRGESNAADAGAHAPSSERQTSNELDNAAADAGQRAEAGDAPLMPQEAPGPDEEPTDGPIEEHEPSWPKRIGQWYELQLLEHAGKTKSSETGGPKDQNLDSLDQAPASSDPCADLDRSVESCRVTGDCNAATLDCLKTTLQKPATSP
jgi:hypothetical protein